MHVWVLTCDELLNVLRFECLIQLMSLNHTWMFIGGNQFLEEKICLGIITSTLTFVFVAYVFE